LHRLYGPVARIAPHELSFASAVAARDIYVGVSVTIETTSAAHASGRALSATVLPTAPLLKVKRQQ
jgi:hypothetical protein